jgi:hypothetical protein
MEKPRVVTDDGGGVEICWSPSPVERLATLAIWNLVRQLEIFRASSFGHHLLSLPSLLNFHQVISCYRHRMSNLETSKTVLRHFMIAIASNTMRNGSDIDGSHPSGDFSLRAINQRYSTAGILHRGAPKNAFSSINSILAINTTTYEFDMHLSFTEA